MELRHALRRGLLALALCLVATTSFAVWDCVVYSQDYLHWRGACREAPVIAGNVVTDGSFAYVSDVIGELVVVEVGDFGRPRVRGSVVTGGDPQYLANDGSRVFMPAGAEGLRVVDASDPDAPVIVATVDTPGAVGDVAVTEHLAILADGTAVRVYARPLSDSSTPIGEVAIPTGALTVSAVGDHVYVGCGGAGGLQVVSLTDPTAPVIVASVPVTGWVRDVVGDDSHAYVTDDQMGIRVLDLADPDAPVEVAVLPVDEQVLGATLAHGRLYLAAGGAGLIVVDIDDPQAPQVLGSLPTGDWGMGVAALDDGVCVADWQGGLQVFAIAGGEKAGPAASLELGGSVADLAVADLLACIAARGEGVHLVDLSDPATPTLMATVDTPGYARGVDLASDHAYVADDSGLRVIALTGPGAPGIVGSLDLPGTVAMVSVREQLATVVAGATLWTVDVSDPTTPATLGSLTLPAAVLDLAFHGDLAYVSMQTPELAIVDLSIPAAPVLVDALPLANSAQHLLVHGDRLYLGSYFVGLDVADIGDPTAPALVEHLDTAGGVVGLAAFGNRLWIGDGSDSVQIQVLVDGSPINNIGTVDLGGSIRAMAMLGDVLIALDDWTDTLHVVWPHCTPEGVAPRTAPAPALALGVYPNPFNPSTRFEFTLPIAGEATLRVYDLRGRLVRTLLRGRLAAGSHAVAWDGTGDDGRSVASGAYICSLETLRGTVASKAVLLK